MQDGIRACNNTIYMYTYSLITVIMATEVSLSPTSVVMDDGDCSEMIPNGLSLPTMVTVACVYSWSAAPPVALVSCTTKLCIQKKTVLWSQYRDSHIFFAKYFNIEMSHYLVHFRQVIRKDSERNSLSPSVSDELKASRSRSYVSRRITSCRQRGRKEID